MSNPIPVNLLFFFLICCIPCLLVSRRGKRFLNTVADRDDQLVAQYQDFRKKSDRIFIISLFVLLLGVAPLFQIYDWMTIHRIPFLLFSALIGFFLFITISVSKYMIDKKFQEESGSFIGHIWYASAHWIITFTPFAFYFAVVIMGRNLTPSVGKFLSTNPWTSIWAMIVWFLHRLFEPRYWQWIYQTSALEDFNIRSELNKIIADSDITLQNIHQIRFNTDTPVNAFALGLWPKIRIVFLSSMLIKKLDISEVKAIFLHEMGHFQYQHIKKQYLLLLTFQFILIMGAWTVGHLMNPAVQSLVFIDGLPFLIFFFEQWIIKIIIGCRQEIEADHFVVQTIQDPEVFISALEKIHQINYLPRRWKGQSHPDLEKRISNIHRLMASKMNKDK